MYIWGAFQENTDLLTNVRRNILEAIPTPLEHREFETIDVKIYNDICL